MYERDFTMREQYTGPREIRFYALEASLALPPEDRPQPRAIAMLPAKGGRVLMVFAPKKVEEEGWKVRILDNSPANFPPGAYRFMNLTPVAIQVALDRKVTPAWNRRSSSVRFGGTVRTGGQPCSSSPIRTEETG